MRDTEYTVAVSPGAKLGLDCHPITSTWESPAGAHRAQSNLYLTIRKYASTVPSPVHICKQPIRVFLVCEDANAQIVKIRSAPKGLRAVVAGEREILVTAPGDFKKVERLEVVAEISSARQPELRIPVMVVPEVAQATQASDLGK